MRLSLSLGQYEDDIERVVFVEDLDTIGSTVHYRSDRTRGRITLRVVGFGDDERPMVEASHRLELCDTGEKRNGRGPHYLIGDPNVLGTGELIGCVIDDDAGHYVEKGRLVEGASPVLRNEDGVTHAQLPTMDQRIGFYTRPTSPNPG